MDDHYDSPNLMRTRSSRRRCLTTHPDDIAAANRRFERLEPFFSQDDVDVINELIEEPLSSYSTPYFLRSSPNVRRTRPNHLRRQRSFSHDLTTASVAPTENAAADHSLQSTPTSNHAGGTNTPINNRIRIRPLNEINDSPTNRRPASPSAPQQRPPSAAAAQLNEADEAAQQDGPVLLRANWVLDQVLTRPIATLERYNNEQIPMPRTSDQNTDFNQFMTMNNWPHIAPIIAPPSNTPDMVTINTLIEQLMHKSIVIRHAQMVNELLRRSLRRPSPQRDTNETNAAQDFHTFLLVFNQHLNQANNEIRNPHPQNPAGPKPATNTVSSPPAPDISTSDLCVICLTDRKEYCIPRCNHLCLCANCSQMFKPFERGLPEIWHKCPMCRTLIEGEPFKIYR